MKNLQQQSIELYSKQLRTPMFNQYVDIPFKKCTLFGILVHPYPVKKCNRYRIVGAVTD